MSSTHSSSANLDSRKRQSKRDDAIRRRIEHDLNKKKKSGAATTRRRKATPGTVLSLKPSDPIICKTTSTVYEVSQLMTAKRENCVLVVDEIGQLLGIFTAKDLAFRIVGSGLNANQVTIDQIMTKDPICANANNAAGEALTLMVEKGFRHLPVLDDDNHIVGVLDITKCYAEQMSKLERMHSSSKKLYEALDSVHNEMGVSEQPQHIFQYFETLKNKMNGPTLENVLDAHTEPIYTNVKASVYEATILMKENRTTAVLVKDTNDEVAGIFTSKDVVLRVIAAGLDPKKCSIVRVMTPQPDVAHVNLPVPEALRKMFDGHYLNLPVVGDEDEIIGIVDVLKLTYVTLNQLKQLETAPEFASESGVASSTTPTGEGPAWNKFWTSLDNHTDGETESAHSDSLMETGVFSSGDGAPGSGAPGVTPSEFHSFNVDIKPSDSVSHVESLPFKASSLKYASSAAIDDIPFTFKFKSPGIEGRVHRISVKSSDGITKLRELIDAKLHEKDYGVLKIESGELYAISYVDDEGDVVSITTDDDLAECIKINLKLENDKADLYLHNPHEHATIDDIKSIYSKKSIRKNKSGSSDLIPGVPNEVLIPSALALLGVSVILGFTFARK
ncbi:Meiotically up-regulated gene 70 protein [Candida viswanathii]|uniref:Meiotically up-regulated gene 70 protein n=1 Tax=Candida viswanathii TaxID=5486 RepID=A0A367YCY4_9ASCO|nr:Meiotically up-regulated gene 70 protein [Candida viswanathii]